MFRVCLPVRGSNGGKVCEGSARRVVRLGVGDGGGGGSGGFGAISLCSDTGGEIT